MPPNVTAAIRARSGRLLVLPALLLVFGGLALLLGLASIAKGFFTMSLPVGAVLTLAGVVWLVRGRSIQNDPVYKVLARPQTVTAMHIARTNLTVGGSAVTAVDSVVISHSGGADVWLPVRKVPMEAVVAELRQLCPHAPWR